MTGSPPPLPHDEELPVAGELLRADDAAAYLRAHLDGAGGVTRVRIRYLAYEPGRRVTVQYQAVTADQTFDAAVTATPAGEHSFRYPHDPALPLLADPGAVIDALQLLDHEPVTRLAWVPTQRAAIRHGATVVKHYAAADDAAAALRHMELVQGVVPTPEPVGAADATARGLVAQQLIAGRTLERVDAPLAVERAVALAARLHRADLGTLPVTGPAELLDMGRAPVVLAGFACPHLAERLARAADGLERSMPAADDLGPSHGDFNVGQLIDRDGELCVVDVDTLCLADAAFDGAAYATNVLSGRAADLDDALALLARVAAADDAARRNLAWYAAASTLRRVDRAIRRLKRDWPERTDRLADALDDLVARL